MSSSKGDTTVKMNFETGGAAQVRGVTKAVYRDARQGMRDVRREAQMTGMTMRSLGRNVLLGVAGLAGLGTAAAGLGKVNQTAQAIDAKQLELERAIVPLSSLGDNAGDLARLRREVVTLASALDTTSAAAAQTLFDLQSGTGNLSDAIRGDLGQAMKDLSKATGGDLATAQNLLTSSYQIYGGEVENVTQLMNKLMYTQDKARIGFEDLATRLPELAGAGKVVGVTLDEVLGTVIGSTLKTGSIEKTFTGLRNVFLIMEEAQKKGITLTGTYQEKLSQLKDLFKSSRGEMIDLFGKQSIVTAQNLASSIDVISGSIEDLGKISGESSKAVEIIAKRLEDPVTKMQELNAINEKLRANAPNIANDTAPQTMLSKFSRNQDLGALAVQLHTGEDQNSWGALFGRVLGGLGSRKTIERGRIGEIQNTAPGPLRDEMLRDLFNFRKQLELGQLENNSPYNAGTYTPRQLERLNAVRARTFDVEAARAEFPFDADGLKEGMGDMTEALKANTAALQSARNATNHRAPGGSPAQGREVL